MTMELYHDTAYACSSIITRAYSTSFSLAIKVLHKRLHSAIYGIYGFVRFADEIVDTFHDYDKKMLLDRFAEDAFRAVDDGISLNPVLHAFQQVVNKYGIERQMIADFLKSMEMDLHYQRYGQEKFEEYIYGSAEVVGLMCLRVFCENDNAMYDKLKEPARSLGAAFQKVNFLRDVQSDYGERGRVYFPGVEWKTFNSLDKKKIEGEISRDFEAAREGIMGLPSGAKLGVYLAYRYYMALFRKIVKLPASRIMQERVRIPDNEKFALLAKTYLRSRFNMI